MRDRQEKTWGSKQGGWRGLREIERVKVPVDSIPKAHPALRDQITRWSRSAGECKMAIANEPGGYTAVAQDAKMEILVKIEIAG